MEERESDGKIMLNWSLFNILHLNAPIAFEAMCYFLFCEQFNQSYGIFRYKNQAGIETEPIEYEGTLIGFQSKYIKDINSSVADICDSINKAKKHNPQLKQYYLYINQEFSEGKKGKKPNAQIKIESCAQANDLELIWMLPSNLEYLLHQKKNEYIFDIFFTEHNGLDKLIEEQQNFRNRQLSLIKTEIIYNAQSIKADRSATLATLEEHIIQGHNIIISGEGGAGKTAVIKDYIEQHSTYPVLFTKGSALYEFETNDINSSFNINRINKAYGDQKVKIFVIDSAEYLLDTPNAEGIQIILKELQESGWKIVLTSRKNRLKELMLLLQSIYHLNAINQNVEILSPQELAVIAEKYYIVLPRNQYLLDRIRNPFYLNEYLSQLKDNIDATISMFNQNVWNGRICQYNKSAKGKNRENCMMSLAKTRATTQSFYIDYESDEIIESLVEDEIIGYDSQRAQYFISHDIFEELSLRRWIDIVFNRMKEDFEASRFFCTIGDALALRRAFRLWLSDKLIADDSDVRLIISCVCVANSSVPPFWVDEIITAIILSPYVSSFFENNEEYLIKNGFELFQQLLFLLNVSGVDYKPVSHKAAESAPVMIPVGDGWRCAVNFIGDHKEFLQLNPDLCLDTLIKWTSENHEGETTKAAGRIALCILKESENHWANWHSEELKIYTIIENSAKAIVSELNDLIGSQLNIPDDNKVQDSYYAFFEYIISDSLRAANIIQSCPMAILKICTRLWYANHRNNKSYYERDTLESHYGVVDEYRYNYFPANAYNSPIWYALNSIAPLETLKFVVDFINQVSQNYKNNPWQDYAVEEVTLQLPNGQTVTQLHSLFFWKAYRGTSSPVMPYLIQSVLMALEKFLLQCGKDFELSLAEKILLDILSNSKSSMLTAVVASVVVAYPDKFFNVACILFQSIEYIAADNLRGLSENHVMSISSGKYPAFYQQVQYKSNQFPHRKMTLEQICFNYQFMGVKGENEENNRSHIQQIYSIIDNLNENLQKKQEKSIEYEVLIARIDRRKNKLQIVSEKDNQILVQFETQLTPDVKQKSESVLANAADELKYTQLYLWSRYRSEGRDKVKESSFARYEEHPLEALEGAREIVKTINNGKSLMTLDAYAPRYMGYIMLRDYYDLLTDVDLLFCRDVILSALENVIYEKEPNIFGDGFEECIKASFVLYEKFEDLREQLSLFYFALLIDKRVRLNKYSWEILSELFNDAAILPIHEILLGNLILIYVQYLPVYKILVKENPIGWGQSIRPIVIPKLFAQMSIPSSKLDPAECIQRITMMETEDLIPLMSIIPRHTTNDFYLKIIGSIMPSLSQLLLEGREEYNYTIRHTAYRYLAAFLLARNSEEQAQFILPFLQVLPQSKDVIYLLSEFVSEADKVNNPDSFWNIWNLLYDSIVKQRMGGYKRREILMNYFLGVNWKETARCWHSLREKDLRFYDLLVKDVDVADVPILLFVINSNMQRIAYPYQSQSVDWNYELVGRLVQIPPKSLISGTISLLENNMTNYIANNRARVRTDSKLRNKLTEILSFAVAQGSAQAYTLRESII
ncbi:MAG: hypothetical protein U0K81_03030 [Paludibacteraceae bacterium]|nr:hypothetical protein [Paludibacteraceae bacterium]